MKRSIFITLFLAVSISMFAERHYTMTIADEKNPGQTITYDIIEPIHKEESQHFVARLIKYFKSDRVSKPFGYVKATFILDENGYPTNTQVVERKGNIDVDAVKVIFDTGMPINPGLINGKTSPFLGVFEFGGLTIPPKITWTPLIGVNQEANLISDK